jgi:hypothetical protein
MKARIGSLQNGTDQLIALGFTSRRPTLQQVPITFSKIQLALFLTSSFIQSLKVPPKHPAQ